jgi:hypothetical protein
MKTLLCLLALMLVGAAAPKQQDPDPLRFTYVDVYVDSGRAALAAWQARLVDPSGRALIVGVEGGEDAAFAEPPYHDPAALQGGEIVLAAFHTGHAGPAGRTRVARLHLAVRGDAPVDFTTTLEVAASDAGRLPEATLTLAR